MPGVNSLVNDPEYHKLPVAKQREALSHFDPEFGNLNDTQIGEFNLKSRSIDYTAKEKSGQLGPQIKSGEGSFGRGVMNVLPNITGALGALVHPAAAPLAAGVGSLIKNRNELFNPDTRKSAAADVLGDVALEGAFSAAAKPFSVGLSRMKDKLSLGFLRRFQTHGDAGPLMQHDVPLSVGQSTQNPTLQFVERVFGPDKAKVALAEDQRKGLESLTSDFRVKYTGKTRLPDSPAEEFGETGQGALKTEFSSSHKGMNAAYRPVKMDAKAATTKLRIKTGEEVVPDPYYGPSTTKPIIEEKEIEGPINYERTAKYMLAVKPQIDKVYNNLPTDSPLKGKFAQFKRVMDDLAQPQELEDGTKKFIADWDTIKQFRSDVNSAIGSPLDRSTRGEAGLKTIADLLGKDVDKSVETIWEAASPGALKRLQYANQVTKEHYDTFTKRVRSTFQHKKGVNPDASQVFSAAESRPEATREMIRALSPQKQLPIKAHFFEKLVEKSKGDPGAALDLMDTPTYKIALSSKERADIGILFKTLQRTVADESKSGKVALALKSGSVAIALGAGAIEMFTGETRLRYPALATATALIGTRSFAKSVLLNPRYARAATKLANLAPDSNEAVYLRKTILGAMRGGKLMIDMHNGKKEPFTVSPSGKLVPDN